MLIHDVHRHEGLLDHHRHDSYTLGMVPYLSALNDWLPRVGGRYLVRDISSDIREGEPGDVSLIIEFPSKAAAVAAYESEEYQAMVAMRLNSSDFTLAITEELGA